MEKTKESIKDYVRKHPELAKMQDECLIGYADFDYSVVEMLVTVGGANVNARYEGDDNEKFYPKGTTPLMNASANGYLDIVEFLVKHGANVNAKDDEFLMTPLMRAADNGHLDVVKFLVKHGADIFEKDKDDKDASDHARDHSHEEVAKYLAELKSAADLGYMKRG